MFGNLKGFFFLRYKFHKSHTVEQGKGDVSKCQNLRVVVGPLAKECRPFLMKALGSHLEFSGTATSHQTYHLENHTIGNIQQVRRKQDRSRFMAIEKVLGNMNGTEIKEYKNVLLKLKLIQLRKSFSVSGKEVKLQKQP